MTRTKPFVAILVLAALGAATAAATEPGPAEPSRPNVAVTLTVGKTGGEPAERSYRMVAQDGSRASMLVGWRMPIPSMSKPAEGATAAPVLSYVYQNVGVNADLAIRILGSGRVLLEGTVEVSGAREGKQLATGETMPIIGTFNQRLTVVATENKKFRVAEAPDPDGGMVHVDLEVDVLE
jgi:hypothetical protein